MSLTQLIQFDSKYKSIEKFANLKEWKFPNSMNWYTVSQNGYSIKMSDTGITLPTKQYSISFFYNLNAIKSSWTNIFHVTNTGNNYGSNGDRIPAVWVFPDQTRFHIRMSTNDSINDGIDVEAAPLNNKILVTFLFDNNIFTMYINNTKKITKTFNNIATINPSALLYIGDPWHDHNKTVNIRDFTIYNGVLTADQISTIYIGGIKSWLFSKSIDWYKVVKNGYSMKMSDTGLLLPAKQYTISFMYNLTELNPDWNNVFHITNTGNNCCVKGDRIPALWVKPNETNFYLKFSTDDDGNDGIDSIEVPLNTKVLITLLFDNNTVTMYMNNDKKASKTFNNIAPITSNALLYIGDPWYNSNGTINIRGFTIYDTVLSTNQIANNYTTIINADAQAEADAKAAAEAKARADADAQTALLDAAQAKLRGIATDTDSNLLKSNKVSPGITSIDRYLDPTCKPNEYIYCLDGQIQCNDILGGNLNKLQTMTSYASGNTLAGCDSHINKVNITDYTVQADLNIGTGVYFDLSNCPDTNKPWRVGNKFVPSLGCFASQSEADAKWNEYIDISLNSKATYLLNDQVYILASFLKTQTDAGLPQLLAVLDSNKQINTPYTTLNGQKYYYGKISAITGTTYTVLISTSKLPKVPLSSVEVKNVEKKYLLKNSLYNPKTNDYYSNLNAGSYPRPICKSGTFTSCLSSPPFTMKNGEYISTYDPTLSIDASYNRTRKQEQIDFNTPFSNPPVNPSGILDDSNLLEYNYFTTKNNQTPFIKCVANHSSNVGDPLCCDQKGLVTDTKFICPQEVPTCMGYSKDDNIYGYCA
jgi:hypothetical protein